jgi:hypothetical protein
MLANGNNPEQPSFQLVKLDSDCNVQWKQTYTQWYAPWVNSGMTSLAQTPDGYVIAGNIKREDITVNQTWYTVTYGVLIKTDISGNIQWNKTYGEPHQVNSFSSVIQSSDGGFALRNNNWDRTGDVHDLHYWLVKTDADGTTIWQKTYGSGPVVNTTFNYLNHGTIGDNEAKAIVQTPDGGYVLAGETYTYGLGDSDVWLVKTDAAGKIVWNCTYGGAGYTVVKYSGGNFTVGSDGIGRDSVLALISTSDGGLAFAGTTPMYTWVNDGYVGTSGSLAWLVKTDEFGAAEWNQTFHPKSMAGNGWVANSIIETSDGGLAFAGTWEYSGSVAYCYLAKTTQAMPAPTQTFAPQTNTSIPVSFTQEIFIATFAIATTVLVSTLFVLKRKQDNTKQSEI